MAKDEEPVDVDEAIRALELWKQVRGEVPKSKIKITKEFRAKSGRQFKKPKTDFTLTINKPRKRGPKPGKTRRPPNFDRMVTDACEFLRLHGQRRSQLNVALQLNIDVKTLIGWLDGRRLNSF